ncbi:MAG: hypothetical protein PW788_05795 [Micavibrio sp.]|nr:hypothetical protein [Micavibrio sp.]
MNAAAGTPFAFSQLFTDLTGRRVTVASGDDLFLNHGSKAYGVYEVVGTPDTILLTVDLPLLGSLGGVLVGLPDTVVRQQLTERPIDDALTDAMREVLNIVSSVLTRHKRAVLKQMVTDAFLGDSLTSEFTLEPHTLRRFHVTMTGYPSGEISMLTRLR